MQKCLLIMVVKGLKLQQKFNDKKVNLLNTEDNRVY